MRAADVEKPAGRVPLRREKIIPRVCRDRAEIAGREIEFVNLKRPVRHRMPVTVPPQPRRLIHEHLAFSRHPAGREIQRIALRHLPQPRALRRHHAKIRRAIWLPYRARDARFRRMAREFADARLIAVPQPVFLIAETFQMQQPADVHRLQRVNHLPVFRTRREGRDGDLHVRRRSPRRTRRPHPHEARTRTLHFPSMPPLHLQRPLANSVAETAGDLGHFPVLHKVQFAEREKCEVGHWSHTSPQEQGQDRSKVCPEICPSLIHFGQFEKYAGASS